jgi:hypothetical protein
MVVPVAFVTRPALRPTQPPIQWVPCVKHGRGVMLTTHPLVVLKLKSGLSRSSTTSFPCHLYCGSGTALYTTVNLLPPLYHILGVSIEDILI